MDERSIMDSTLGSQVAERYFPVELRETRMRWCAYREELRLYARAAETAATATQRAIVDPLAQESPERFVCRLERHRPFTKSPESIDIKISRYLSGRPVAGETAMKTLLDRLDKQTGIKSTFLRIFFRELPSVMNDLARFRIVTNYLSDVHRVRKAFLEERLKPYGVKVDPRVEDRIEEDRWEEGASGHRAIHVRLYVPTNGFDVPIEVQAMTLLEVGWTEKAHRLYEIARCTDTETIDRKTRLRIRAMSDALYVADALFDDVNRDHFESGSANTEDEEQ